MWRSALARLGFAATGVLYVALGIAAAGVGIAGARSRSAGFPGALRLLLRQPHGRALVAAVAVGFGAFALWHLLEARDRRRGALERIGHAGSVLGYVGLCWTSVLLLLRLRQSHSTLGPSVLSGLLSHPLGVIALEAAGAVTIAVGLFEIGQGVTGRLRERFATRWLSRDGARALRGMARFGLASRGVVLAIIGVFQIRVAVDLDPKELQEIGGALKLLSRSPTGGPVIAGVVSLGLIAYGLYMGALAVAGRR